MAKEYKPVFIARQPIFHEDKSLAAYELLFRHSGQASVAHIMDGDRATSGVIADGVSLATEGLGCETRIFINFPKRLLLEKSALSLSPEVCVVEVLETVAPELPVLEALMELKDLGYTLALDDFVGQRGYEPFLELADIVKVDFLGGDPLEIMRWVHRLKPYNLELLAEKVEDQEAFELGKDLGCKYFQGYYFSRPQTLSGRTLRSESLGQLQIMNRLNDDECDMGELSLLIGQNLALSYRLLRFINSSAFSFRAKVNSIRQAVAMLGLIPLKRWIMVVLISDMNDSPPGREMTFSSLQRAYFLESLGKRLKNSQYSPETMFMLGLFSKLDALLGMDMEEALRNMPLEDEIRLGLMGEKNTARDWLDLLDALEWARYDLVDALLDRYGVDHQETAWLYADALGWAHRILSQVQE